MGISNMLEHWHHRCAYCGVRLARTRRQVKQLKAQGIPADRATKDHYIPKCQGGKGNLANLVLCCHKCNSSVKKDMHPQEFLSAEQRLWIEQYLTAQVKRYGSHNV